MKDFLDSAVEQESPLFELRRFIEQEDRNESAGNYEAMRFVGYILEIGFSEMKIITADNFKISVGGVPRNSLLIVCPDTYKYENQNIPLHFTLIRVLDSAPIPLSNEVQQTYFELHKKSMPELDIFTKNELQWGALRCNILGMFYTVKENGNEKIEFAGDLNNYLSAHRYKVFSPDDKILDLVTNSIVPKENRFKIGKLRLTENRLPFLNKKRPNVNVFLSTKDFMGARTSMFGKTRLGKSNVVKLIVQSLIETTKGINNVGQLIFDINGEYANDNPQDDNFSIASKYPKTCEIYALNEKKNTASKPLKLNFYEHPNQSHKILRPILEGKGKTSSTYIDNFLSSDIPKLTELNNLPNGDKKRARRKILIYWAILKKAGFPSDESKLKELVENGFNLGVNKSAKKILFEEEQKSESIDSLDDLVRLLDRIVDVDRRNKLPSSTKNKDLFDAEDETLFDFFKPKGTTSSGVNVLKSAIIYHDKYAGNFTKEILISLDKGKTVILDLGNANEIISSFFSRQLSKAIFNHQSEKFSNNELSINVNEKKYKHFVQLYFEEAHNLFGYKDMSDDTEIYRRFAKEGAKYHIGMVYSTQSPSTVNADLLAQTENFFVAHLSSRDDVNKLAKTNIAYESLKEDILQAKTVGYMRMLTRSHKFVISLQATPFSLNKENDVSEV